MSSQWHEFHEALMRTTSTLDFQRQFEAVRKEGGVLSAFHDRASLLDYLHHSADPAAAKNAILSALVGAAQERAPSGDCGLTLMLLALWPGLDAAYHRVRARGLVPHDELASELAARAVVCIRTLDLARVEWIAATILRNIERDIMRAHQRRIGRERRQRTLDEVPPALVATSMPDRSRGHLHDEIVGLIGHDGAIVMRVAVDGSTQAEVAAEFGLSAVAARKRYQRASWRLRNLFQDCR